MFERLFVELSLCGNVQVYRKRYSAAELSKQYAVRTRFNCIRSDRHELKRDELSVN